MVETKTSGGWLGHKHVGPLFGGMPRGGVVDHFLPPFRVLALPVNVIVEVGGE